MAKHDRQIKFEPKIEFREKPITGKQSKHEQYFGEPHRKKLYLGFDFEALL